MLLAPSDPGKVGINPNGGSRRRQHAAAQRHRRHDAMPSIPKLHASFISHGGPRVG